MSEQHWRLIHLLDGGVMVALEHRQCTARSRSFPLGHGERERHNDSDVDMKLTPSAVNFFWKRCYISTDLPSAG